MDIDKEIKKQINDWFFSDRNYKVGLSLLKEAGFSQRGLLKTLDKGETKDNKLHLTFQLFKFSDHKDKKICNFQKEEKLEVNTLNLQTANGKKTDAELSFEEGTTEANLLAQIVEKQKMHYNKRALAHKEMTALGDSNESKIVTKRLELLEAIKKHTSVVDYLHNIKLKWKETGVMPDQSVLEFEAAAEENKKDIVVDEIPEVDLQNELAKVRSRLSKYAAKMKNLTGKKLETIKEKQTADERLKAKLIEKLNAVRSK